MSRVAKTGHSKKRRPLPNLNLDETRGKHASSIFGVSTREAARKASARSLAIAVRRMIMQPRQGAAPCNYGEAQRRATMNTLRRLCATMPPTHVPHPPFSFSVQLLHRNGAFSRIFDLEGSQPYIRALPPCSLARVIFTPKNCQKNGGFHQVVSQSPCYFGEQRIG